MGTSSNFGNMFGTLLPFTPLAALLGFVHPPPARPAAIALMVVIYLAVAELMKRRLYRGHFD